ncbi:MAG: pyrroline-5-carboxylate reductase [Lachnospiraceae bacterium]|jgi:pyrroline-5-carboxylate reductase|nr:pyrroline-5-carboxylate reductase [Lachnospiraceae bacterium]
MVIGFIGLGNMAKAMISGILAGQLVQPGDITGSAATEETRQKVSADFGIRTSDSNSQVAAESDIIVLAVKPQYLPVVIEDINDNVDDSKLIVSIAAGKTTKQLTQYFSRPVKIVRCMPNTPALVGAGCSAVCRSENVTDAELESAMKLLRCCGLAEVVPESLMDAVVGVSGSSPAFVFMFIEAMADAAVREGMPRQQAYRFAAQSVMGSAKLMLETGKTPAELKDMVCSPAGTTIEGVAALEKGAFRASVIDAVTAASERSKKM